jgi:hypothetical protein
VVVLTPAINQRRLLEPAEVAKHQGEIVPGGQGRRILRTERRRLAFQHVLEQLLGFRESALRLECLSQVVPGGQCPRMVRPEDLDAVVDQFAQKHFGAEPAAFLMAQPGDVAAGW